jgi:6-phosphofructokinase 2
MARQRPILTVTLNPAVDLAARTARVEPGPKLRLSAPVADPGGGGINVARAARLLGGEARAFVALGGAMGAQLGWMLRQHGLPFEAFEAPGETRHSLTVMEEASGLEYRFVLPGADWTGAQANRALDAIDAAAGRGGMVVLSGSQPPGVPDDFPSRLAARLAGRETVFVVDTSGAALDRLVDVPERDHAPALLRMDGEEAEAIAGRPLPSPAETADFAAALVRRGVARQVVLARGADGSVLVEAGRRLHCRPPEVAVHSKVGAGDSFTGALVLALARGEDAAAALRLGTAAAAAAVMTPGTELCRPEDVARLAPGCALTEI